MSYLFTKTAVQALGAFNVIAFRFTVACVVSAAIFCRRLVRIGRNEIVYGCLLGTLLSGATSSLAVGLQSTTISNAGFIIGSMVLFVAVMDAAAARRKPHTGLIAGVLLALAGIGVLTLRGQLTINPGDVYCFGATVLLSFHVMAAQRAARRADPVGASIIQFAATSVLAWTASFMSGVIVLPHGMLLLAILGLGVVGTAAAFVCQVAGQKFVSPTRTAFLFTLEPIFATLFAWVFLQEQVTWHVYAGGGLLLSGVYVSEYGSRTDIGKPSRTRYDGQGDDVLNPSEKETISCLECSICAEKRRCSPGRDGA